MLKRVKGFAPATVANVACGFDVLGFAIDAPGDEIILEISDDRGVRIRRITGDQGMLSKDAKINVAGVVVNEVLKLLNLDQQIGIEIELVKKMPLGSGMGSSAASSAVAAFCANHLLGNPLSELELLKCAMEGERCACGSAHADNVAPALYGGFVLIRSYTPLDVIRLPVPADLHCTLIHPDVIINTALAREMLPAVVVLEKVTRQCGNLGGLVSGLFLQDYSLIKRSLTDVIVEPVRKNLIPNFAEIKTAALNAGALGCSISGSGPSIFALSESKFIAQKVAECMTDIYRFYNVKNEVYVSKINLQGSKILEQA